MIAAQYLQLMDRTASFFFSFLVKAASGLDVFRQLDTVENRKKITHLVPR